jgi:REP element-mobilizing transposase RayT
MTPGSIMPRREEFEENQYYHVYNRWLNKQKLFFCWKDFERFLRYITQQQEIYKDKVSIISYSVLPNHFHFVILNKETGFALSEFIWKITSSYGKYIWAKYWMQWNWKLFESRFKAKLLDSEEYLNQCVHYVEFNAIKHWVVDDINKRPFTSFDKTRWNTPYDEILALDWEFS